VRSLAPRPRSSSSVRREEAPVLPSVKSALTSDSELAFADTLVEVELLQPGFLAAAVLGGLFLLCRILMLGR
jgi:hypothetical protein